MQGVQVLRPGDERLDGPRDLIVVDKGDMLAMWPVLGQSYAGRQIAGGRRIRPGQDVPAIRDRLAPLARGHVRVETHWQTAQIGVLGPFAAGGSRDKEHGVQAHCPFGQRDPVAVPPVAVAQCGKAHRTARDVISLLKVECAQHSFARSELGHGTALSLYGATND